MKAYRLDNFTSIDDLHLYNELAPKPQRGEVLVRVHAVSLNFRDIAMVRDQYPVPHLKGLIPTSDGAGEVLAVGAGVDDFKVGDRVMSTFHPRWYAGRRPANLFQYGYGAAIDGWLVEQKVVSQEALVRMPDSLSYEEAATLPCAAVTAWTALNEGAAVRAGGTVLVQGSGGVSIFALQLAKAVGATVLATTSSAKKAERLLALGADKVVNYLEEPQWGDRVRALAQGQGVERIVEVGGPGTLAQSLRAVRPGGEVALIGFVSPEGRHINYLDLFMSGATFRHITVGSRESLMDVAQAIDVAGIKPVIDRVFDFADARAAFAHLDSGAHFGKVVIRCA